MNDRTRDLFHRLEAERQEEIVRGIIASLAETGISGANVRKIAQRIGMSHGSLFHYFPTKEDMIAEIIFRGSSIQRSAFQKGMEDAALVDLPVRDRLRQVLRFVVAFGRKEADLVAVWLELGLPHAAEFAEYHRKLELEGVTFVKDLIKSAGEKKLLMPGVDPSALSYLIDSLFSYLLKRHISDTERAKFSAFFGRIGDEKLVERLMTVLGPFFVEG